MAGTQYSPRNAEVNDIRMMSGDLAPNAAVANTAAEQGGAMLGRTLLSAGLKIDLLRTAVEALNLTMSLQRSLLQTSGAGIQREAVSGQMTTGNTGGGIEPPAALKSAIAMNSAIAELGSIARFTPQQREEMAPLNLQMATAPLVAAGGTRAVDLVKIEILAAKAGIGNELPNASDRQFELLKFANDAAVTASAMKIPAMQAAEMMGGWRTSMSLDRDRARDLADAANHLGQLPGDAQAADIGNLLQHYGAVATAAGLQPEHAAALSAALLNTGTQKADAGEAFKSIISALGKGDQATTTERAAWKQLKIDPREVAGLLRDKDSAPGVVMSVLAALNAQTADKRSALAATLFANGDAAALRMAQNLGDVNEAFGQVKDKTQYATSALGDKGSIRQSALVQANTQQGQWNIFNARNDRLSTATGNALAPAADITLASLGSLANGLSGLAEKFPAAAAVIVVAAAVIKPLIGGVFKAIVDEITNQAAKRVLGGVASLPGRIGKGFSEDLKTADAKAKTQTSGADHSGKPLGLQDVRAPAARYSLGPVAKLRSLSRRAPGPLKIIGAVADVAEGVMAGNSKMVVAGLGAAGGGWAGAAAGSAAGAALGSVVPLLGTAIGGLLGGLIGGWAGSESGASLGEKLTTPATDRLGAPAQISNNLMSTQADNQPVTFNSTIQINGQDLASAQELANLVVQTTLGQLGQLMPTNALATRRDTALTDGVD